MKIKKLAASALGTLMAGASLAFPAAAANLEDLPQPFIQDGEADFSMVVGEQAQTADVVGAIDMAVTMGGQPTIEETAEVEGGVSGTWTANNGLTLNRENTNLFIDDTTASGQTRLDGEDISALETTTFDSADNNEVEIEHDLKVGKQDQQFDTEGDYDNPVLHVNNPTSPSSGEESNLFSTTVEFSDTIDFTVAGTEDSVNAEEYIEDGDTIELFGREYSFSDESNKDELVLYGSSERAEVDTGEETTITSDGGEVTVEVSYVPDGADTATVAIDGETQSIEEGDTVGPNGNIRVSDIYRTGVDGQGRVAFSMGSEELILIDDGTVEVDGEEVDGVETDITDDAFDTLGGITFYFGAHDNDEDFIEAGETYEDPVFGLQFHYGGLNPDTADEENAAGVIEVNAPEEDVAEVTFTTADGEEATVPVHTYDSDTDDGETSFGPEDGTIAQYEGQAVEEEDMVILNSFDEADMYEVTDVSDTDLNTAGDDSELSATLENVVTGDSVTVEEDGLNLDGDSTYTINDESIEGKDYDVTFEGGDEVSFKRSADEGKTQLWPAMYTATDSAIAFDAAENIDSDAGSDGIHAKTAFDLTADDFEGTAQTDTTGSYSPGSGHSVTISDSATMTVEIVGDGSDGTQVFEDITTSSTIDTSNIGTVSEVTVLESDVGGATFNVNDGANDLLNTAASAAATADFTAELPSGVASNDATATVTFSSTTDSDFTVSGISGSVQYDVERDGDDIDLTQRSDNAAPGTTGVLVSQPENDDEQEEAYILETKSESSGAADVAHYTGYETNNIQLDDEDVTVNYDEFGAYVADDEEADNSETLTVNMPGAQATAGMAMTGTDGELTASGSAGGDVTYDKIMPVYDAIGALDTEVADPASQDLILVGGPSVNTLVDDLVQDGKMEGTGVGDNETEAEEFEWQEDTPEVQLVEDAFADGQTALVVAGWEAEDTRDAANRVQNHFADNALPAESTFSLE